MKHVRPAFLPALALFALAVVATPASAADSRNVSVVNETGYAIKFLGFNAPDDGIGSGRMNSTAS